MIPEQGRKPTRPACGPPNSEGAIMLPMPLRGEPTGSSAGGGVSQFSKGYEILGACWMSDTPIRSTCFYFRIVALQDQVLRRKFSSS